MKKLTIGLLAAGSLCASVAVAQEHWTEGPVWECSAYRTNPGQFDNYMKWLRSHSLVTTERGQEAGPDLGLQGVRQAASRPGRL